MRALVALLAAVACAPDEVCGADSELRTREGEVAGAHDACERDEDCTTLNANVECPGADAIGRCSLIVSEGERDEAADELAEVHGDICARPDVSCIQSVDCGAVQPVCRDGKCKSG